MRQWRDVAILALKDENVRYRTLLGPEDRPADPDGGRRASSPTPGARSPTPRLANAGREKGVKAGNPVMSENGLIGPRHRGDHRSQPACCCSPTSASRTARR